MHHSDWEPAPKWVIPVLFLLFFASGACALVYEVVWVRILTQVLGSTTFATSTILSAFMAGLAIGSFSLGKLIDWKKRPLLTYAVLEAGIGLSALVLPDLFTALTPVYVWACRHLGESPHSYRLVQIVLCFALVLFPTVLMGGTLPVLSKFAARRKDSVGRVVGGLYAVNTLGGVVGCFVSGFFLIGAVGIRATTRLTVITNLVLAAAAFILSRREGLYADADDPGLTDAEVRAGAVPARASEENRPGQKNLVLWAVGLSGLTGLAYEVLWTRVLVFFSPGVVIYSFSAMLVVFLSGFALGSGIGGLVADRAKRLERVFAGMQMAVALTCLLAIPLVARLHSIADYGYLQFSSDRYWQEMSIFFLTCAALVFLPSVFLGTAFPIASRIYAQDLRKMGGRIGALYAANTAGAIVGSVGAGFILLPWLGTRRSLIVVAFINLLTVGLMVKGHLRGKKVANAGLACGAVFFVLFAGHFWMDQDAFAPMFAKGNEDLKTIYAREGIGGTVTVQRLPDHSRLLSISGVNVAGTDFKFRTTQKLQAHLPLLLHGHPQDVLQIGFGSGETAWSVTRHDIRHVDSVEITPEVLEALPCFADVNQNVRDQERLKINIDDIRGYLVRSPQKYDVILSDSIHPTVAGNGSLYTVEHFRLCKERLRADGIFSTWTPLYELGLDDFKVILRSMKAVFPYVYLWHTPAGRNQWCILTGMMKPLALDIRRFEQSFNRDEVRTDLAEIMITDCRQLLSYFLLDNEGIDLLAGPTGERSTDDNGYLEYVAAKNSFGPIDRHQGVKKILKELVARRGDVSRYLKADAQDAALRGYILERDHILAGRLLELGGRFNLANLMYRRALKANPQSETAWDMLGCSRIAKEILFKAMRGHPNDYMIYQGLGYACLNGEDLPGAMRWFKMAIRIKPDAIDSHFGLGKACFGSGAYGQAVEQLKIVEQLGPPPWVAEKVKKGFALIYSKRRAGCLPESEEARARLGEAYWDRGSFDLATAEFAKVAELDPRSVTARLNLAGRYEDAWELDKAAGLFREILRIDPGNQVAREHMERLEKMLHKDVLALASAYPGMDELNARPDRSTPYYSKAMAYWKKRQFGEAARELEKAAKYAPGFLKDLARLYEIQGRYEPAIEALQDAVKNSPEDEEAKRRLMALTMLSELSQQSPGGGEKYLQLLSRLGFAYWQNKEFEKAKEVLRRILAFDPGSADIHFNLGMCYESTGELAEAVGSYRKALELNPHMEMAGNALARLLQSLKEWGKEG